MSCPRTRELDLEAYLVDPGAAETVVGSLVNSNTNKSSKFRGIAMGIEVDDTVTRGASHLGPGLFAPARYEELVFVAH